ncbi:uncharacterized protein MYCFIDRAFT_75465 [Pseudocercospora fijiensis CIRAD86]|uniref:Sas10 C-terminal domain-containing protein n=1 Tax=Pseudocercospora fijiensis (strain CIRAD86) TaxID=383855 RepID=N1Q7J0_PSEFD|nr:uncharacterized protein MYCFIDRAFT_75465 [Pseudocercospora fijiensis CIRAD86]EME87616.1 hypothetical protein MYCFIDRAFT_75465 [Pseudocercospora fijiensis CIRAD86]
MAKKRKAAVQLQEPANGLEIDPRESRKRIRTYDDVANSDDDEFHGNQDEIRLGEDPAVKRRREIAENEQFLEQSDEEVLGYSEGDDSDIVDHDALVVPDRAALDSDDADAAGVDEDDEEGLRWGTSKDDLYGDDAPETEEQALEQEAEAIRLQKKQLQQMTAADYGFDEDDWQQAGPAKTTQDADESPVVTEVLPQLQISPDLGSAERLKLLKSRYPEFEHLSKELLRLQNVFEALRKIATKSAVSRTKLRAASAYLGALVMYFSLMTSTASKSDEMPMALSAHKLHEHTVMDSLVKCRELWTSVETLQEPLPVSSDKDEDALDQVSSDEEMEGAQEPVVSLAKREGKKSRAERYADATREAAEQRKAERLKRTEAHLAELDAALAPSKKKTTKTARKRQATADDSDLGEEASLTAREAADKTLKKKSLRFYTSQIAQKANKRGTAGRNAGGDDDIPHRERLKDRQARLNAEAEKRGRRPYGHPDADLGGDSDDEDRRQAQQIRADADENDYYDLVAARTAKRKGEKAALAEAQKQASLQGGRVVQEETVGEDGKRKISYAIEKNKGLTPHRKKDVRNPRVKKRKKFDEKKKKLASIKPVYKGGEGRGGYGGELTGIKKGLVKSTKLS